MSAVVVLNVKEIREHFERVDHVRYVDMGESRFLNIRINGWVSLMDVAAQRAAIRCADCPTTLSGPSDTACCNSSIWPENLNEDWMLEIDTSLLLSMNWKLGCFMQFVGDVELQSTVRRSCDVGSMNSILLFVFMLCSLIIVVWRYVAMLDCIAFEDIDHLVTVA